MIQVLSLSVGTKITWSISIYQRPVCWTILVCILMITTENNTTAATVDDTKQHNRKPSLWNIIGYRHSNHGHPKSVLWRAEQMLVTKDIIACRSGKRYPHVSSCRLYIECNLHGNGYVTKHCPDYLTFDPDILICSSLGSPCDTVLLRQRRSVSDSDADINSDMGSGELSDANTADIGLQPSGNDTAEVIEPKPNLGDDTIKVGVTVPANHVSEDHVTDVMPVVHDVTEPKLTDTVTMTTTVITTRTTPESITTAEMTSKSVTTSLKVIVTDKLSPKPPYVIVTDEPVLGDVTTTKNVTKTVPENISAKSSNTGAIIGVVLGLLIIVVIIGIIVILIKKKKIKMPKKMKKVSVRRKKIVTKMENPQYQDIGGKDYRFSCDTPLHIGGRTANLTKFNNPNLADTPVPRVLQNESPSTAKRSSLPRSIANRRDKRKAPPPPNPFGEYDQEKGDLYETASQASGELEMQTFAVRNENATDPSDKEHEPSYPLLKRTNSRKTDEQVKDKNDNDNRDTDNVPAASSDSLLPKDKNKDKIIASKTPDDYDASKNPFFGGD